jgi:hypothetical protein
LHALRTLSTGLRDRWPVQQSLLFLFGPSPHLADGQGGAVCFRTIRAAVAFTTPCGFVDRTRQPAGSIDSLIRVSRRAEGGPGRPKPHSCCLHHTGTPRQPGGRQRPGGHPRNGCSHPGPPPRPQTVSRGVHWHCPEAHQGFNQRIHQPAIDPFRDTPMFLPWPRDGPAGRGGSCANTTS